MNRDIKLIVYSVQDLATAKKLYIKFLNTDPYVDGAYYVGFKVGDTEVGLIPKPQGQTADSPIVYTDVGDIRHSLMSLSDIGAEVLQDVRDVGGGLLVATIKDADGHVLGLRQLGK